jgi:hypothetical protein
MSETPVDYIAQANLVHTNGPYVTPPNTLYFTYLRPDGLESFIGPASAAEMHLREGCTITGEETIEDVPAWIEEQSAKSAPKAAPKAKAEHEPEPEHEHEHESARAKAKE